MDPVRLKLHSTSVANHALDEILNANRCAFHDLEQMGGDPEMLLDEYDSVEDKPEVADIHPDDLPKEPDAPLSATDCMRLPTYDKYDKHKLIVLQTMP